MKGEHGFARLRPLRRGHVGRLEHQSRNLLQLVLKPEHVGLGGLVRERHDHVDVRVGRRLHPKPFGRHEVAGLRNFSPYQFGGCELNE